MASRSLVTVMTGNHCANNQKDPYVSTITYLSNWPYIVCTITSLNGDIDVAISLDRDLLLAYLEEIAIGSHMEVKETGDLVKDINY